MTVTDSGLSLGMVDLSHHLNAHSRARHPSPLKDILKFMAYDGMISFAGGTSFLLET
jgi:aromatic amino acid aminotransferase I